MANNTLDEATTDASSQRSLPTDSHSYTERKRVAFVTGAGSGIGKSIALRLAKDGLDVAVNDINAASLQSTIKAIEALGARATAVVGDVSDPDVVPGMIDKVVSDLGYLDVMVANAGIELTKSLLDTTAAEFNRLLSVNTLGVFLCYKYASKHFIRQGTGGKLIAASSIAGIHAEPFLGAYSATKFAVRGINQAAAAELAPYGITANVYAPGPVQTPLWDRVDRDGAALTNGSNGAMTDAVIKRIPLKRTAAPEDVSNLASFFASRDSDYITGQAFAVDGGARMT